MSNSIPTLRWAILGTGNIAKTFAKAVKVSQFGELVAVGSRSQESADKFGDEHEIPNRHATYDLLLADPEVDAVYISTPHPLHAEWAIKTAQSGKGILCEKPLTLNHPEAMRVVEAARRHNVFLMEAFMYRAHPQTAKIDEIVRSGEIGDVRLMQISFAFNCGENYELRLLKNELGGGGILDVGCYCVSFARLMAGAATGKPFAEPTDLQGMGQVGPSGVDEWAVANLKFAGPSDAPILAQLTTGVRCSTDSHVRIYGSKGWIEVPSSWFCGATDGFTRFSVNSDGKTREEKIEEVNLYANEADTVARFWHEKQAPSPAMSMEDSLGNMRTLDWWRQEIGVQYEGEKLDNRRQTAPAQPLKVLEETNEVAMRFGSVKHLKKPISRLVLGTMFEGGIFSEAQGFALMDDFFERGGNCFDLAHIYGGGSSDKIVGAWLQSRGVRDQVTLIAKGAHPPHCTIEGMNRELSESLDRLGLDSVDIYMPHRDNPQISVGEWVDAFNQNLRAGRFQAFGGSNWSMDRVAEANYWAQNNGMQGFSALSNNFSLARMVSPVWDGCVSASDAESRQWLEQNQIANFAWSSQARGFFARANRDYTADEELVRCWYSDDNFQRLERAKELAAKRGVEPTAIALAYVLHQPFPTFALIGPRQLSETRTSLSGLDIELSPDEVKWLNLED